MISAAGGLWCGRGGEALEVICPALSERTKAAPAGSWVKLYGMYGHEYEPSAGGQSRGGCACSYEFRHQANDSLTMGSFNEG